MFDTILTVQGAKVHKLPVQSPNLNAYAERFVQTLKQECCDHFIILGEKHLHYLVHEFVNYYHQLRPHQGKDNELLLTSLPQPTDGEVLCEERLGGLLKHYYRQAAYARSGRLIRIGNTSGVIPLRPLPEAAYAVHFPSIADGMLALIFAFQRSIRARLTRHLFSERDAH